ncbi:unnamed protein product [Moneuplotes crassus]|uniref:Uncharacterized protein n=1 Tax=Euplotes crassus TaxID=5936 RepID=A0AAD1YB46_EUPCR|nr:unnamed protein product [Moneuplotes crassus]
MLFITGDPLVSTRIFQISQEREQLNKCKQFLALMTKSLIELSFHKTSCSLMMLVRIKIPDQVNSKVQKTETSKSSQ